MSDKRFFSANEIDSLIPELENIFTHIEVCRNRAEALASKALTLPAAKTNSEVVQVELVRSQVEFLLEAVQDDVHHIYTLGGVTKDIDQGLVDFPGDIDGREVWLCWKRGEDRVRFWHSLEEGFAQRRTLIRPGLNSTLH